MRSQINEVTRLWKSLGKSDIHFVFYCTGLYQAFQAGVTLLIAIYRLPLGPMPVPPL